MAKRIKGTQESGTGRNLRFKDPRSGQEMNRQQFVRKIESGKYENDYHVRKINGVKTPVSNPDGKEGNNLG